MEVPEELDVCVAQRHFEEALSLLQKAKEYVSQHKSDQADHVLLDTERKVNQSSTFFTLLHVIYYIFLTSDTDTSCAPNRSLNERT